MYRFTAPMKLQIATSAAWNANSSIAASTTRVVSPARARISASAAPGAGVASATCGPKFTSIVVARETRLPRSLARSALSRSTRASSEKFASWPNGISRRTK